MAQINPGQTFVNGQQVRAEDLNNLVGGATALQGIIIEQPAFGINPGTGLPLPDEEGKVQYNDMLLISDTSVEGLRKISYEDLFSNVPAVTAYEIVGPGDSELKIYSDSTTIEPRINIGYQITGNNFINATVTAAANPVGQKGQVHFDDSVVFQGSTSHSGNSSLLGTYVRSGGGIVMDPLSLLKVPVVTSSTRPNTTVYGNLKNSISGSGGSASTAELAGVTIYNQTTKRLEIHNGTEWKQINQAEDLVYKTYSRVVTTIPGVTPGSNGWAEAGTTWQWQTGQEIDVPDGQTWEYTIYVKAVATTWDNTRVEYQGDAVAYIGDTPVRTVKMSTNAGGGTIEPILKFDVNDTDTASPKRIGLKFVRSGGTGNIGVGIKGGSEGSYLIVSVTKRPKADQTEINNIL